MTLPSDIKVKDEKMPLEIINVYGINQNLKTQRKVYCNKKEVNSTLINENDNMILRIVLDEKISLSNDTNYITWSEK